VFHHSTTAAAVAAAAKKAVKNSAKRPDALRSRPSSGGSKLGVEGGGMEAAPGAQSARIM
jgi:hypothetical protein